METGAVFLSVDHFMSTVCLEHCIWDIYESVTVPFIGNIKCLVLPFLECCGLKTTMTTQKNPQQTKKKGRNRQILVLFFPRIHCSRRSLPRRMTPKPALAYPEQAFFWARYYR